MIVSETADKIKSMEIRGAGRIARAVAEALRDHALSARATTSEAFRHEMEQAASLLLATRPTAVSLPNAVHIVMAGLEKAMTVDEARAGIVTRAEEFIRSSQHAVEQIARFGASHIRDGDTILTHCNSEVALGCIIEAHRQGKEIEVFATEVRPRNQGLITIRTLNDAGIKTNFIVDSAVRSFINDVDLVIGREPAGVVVRRDGVRVVRRWRVEQRGIDCAVPHEGRLDDVVPPRAVQAIAQDVFVNLNYHAVEDDHSLHHTFNCLAWDDLLNI